MGLYKTEDACAGGDLKCLMAGWLWQDGTPYDPTVWHHWFHTCLTPAIKCAVITHNGWKGRECSKKASYICEKGRYS